MNGEAAGLRWTGHALLDVGVAGLCALCGRDSPEYLTLADLDRASDFIAEHYFSGKLDPYLSVVFMNSGYSPPNKVKNPEDYAEVSCTPSSSEKIPHAGDGRALRVLQLAGKRVGAPATSSALLRG